MQKHLKGVDYPASKKDLIKHAKEHEADRNALSALKQIPDEKDETPTDVGKAIGDTK